jgi:hypothetical protein
MIIDNANELDKIILEDIERVKQSLQLRVLPKAGCGNPVLALLHFFNGFRRFL